MTEHAKRSSQVKVEQPSSGPGLKIEKLECSETAASEIAMLKEEAQRRELKLLELNKQNERLKSKRATDADRIAELEAEVASLKCVATAKVKREVSSLHGFKLMLLESPTEGPSARAFARRGACTGRAHTGQYF